MRYNCSIIASITDRHITSDFAIRTLQKALDSQSQIKGELMLHSDQGPQYTSKAFTEFFESVNNTQSMSKARYPYDNAPMEQYFNTPKNECVNLHKYKTEEYLYAAVEKLRMSTTTMSVHTAITDTERHTRRGLRNGRCGRLREWIAWLCKIGSDGYR